jgi:hypothetical protein
MALAGLDVLASDLVMVYCPLSFDAAAFGVAVFGVAVVSSISGVLRW